jgi:hypothetical protein
VGSELTAAAVAERTDAGSVIGRQVGNYSVLEEIGRGGMAVVYLARQLRLERSVALKALHGAVRLPGETGEILARESRLASSLSHPNIVTVYEYLEEEGIPYIAMEYLARGSLRPWMGCMSLAQFAGVLEDLLGGLAAVAPAGIVHRDLKPENVMVTADGHAKIADFGIAKATQRGALWTTAATPTGITVGTPAYMAPEQALCDEVGPWTDLYSIGVIAFEHLVGHVPFHDAGTPMMMLVRHVRDTVPAPATVDPRIDPALSQWVAQLLTNDPAERTQDALSAWEQLEEIVIERLGPMWRRDARLTERPRARIATRRLDPRQFASQRFTVDVTDRLDPVFTEMRGSPPRTQEAPTRAGGNAALTAAKARVRGHVLVAGGIALATLAGFGVARAARGGSAAARASAAGFSIVPPSGWTARAGPGARYGYAFTSSLALGPPGGKGGLTLGMTKSATATLLPATLHVAGHASITREEVRLGGASLFRYPDIADAGGAVAAYTLPTSRGILAAVCTAPVVPGRCEQILSSLHLLSSNPLPLAQGVTYMSTLSRAIAAFDGERGSLLRQLDRATTPSSQATIAGRLRSSASRTASALSGATPGPSETTLNATLTRSVDGLAAGYGTLSAGAASRSQSEYAHGAREISASEKALDAALAGLKASG